MDFNASPPLDATLTETEIPPAPSPEAATPMVPATRVEVLAVSILASLVRVMPMRLDSWPLMLAVVSFLMAFTAKLPAPAPLPEAAIASARA